MAEDSKESIMPGSISDRGAFVDRSEVGFIKQAAENLGGIKVEELGDRLTDGMKNRDSQTKTGVKVAREDGEANLSAFWVEVRRLENESKKSS